MTTTFLACSQCSVLEEETGKQSYELSSAFRCDRARAIQVAERGMSLAVAKPIHSRLVVAMLDQRHVLG